MARETVRRKRSGIATASDATCGFGGKRYSIVELNKKNLYQNDTGLAGETRFEHATYGFGDRYSTVEPLP